MNNSPCVLTLDFGTQSVRASLIDKNGNIVHIIKEPYQPAYFSTQKGYAEQDPDFYWDLAIKTMTQLAKEAREYLGNIIGATITTFRDSSVQLDVDLRPIRPCILWLDQRMAEAKEQAQIDIMAWITDRTVNQQDASRNRKTEYTRV